MRRGRSSSVGPGTRALAPLDPESAAAFPPNWALAARLWSKPGRHHEASNAHQRAIGLREDAAMRAFPARAAA